MEIAERIRSGMTAVNGVITFAAIPRLPFGGVGDSGFGRIHGADGLREFTYAKAIARQRFKPLLALTSFTRTAKADQQLAQLVTMLHGRGTTIPKRGRRAVPSGERGRGVAGHSAQGVRRQRDADVVGDERQRS